MNAHRKPSPTSHYATLRDRADSLRAATVRQAPAPSLDACIANARSYVEQFDFAAFSIKELGRLYLTAKEADRFWGHLGNMPLCATTGADGFARLNNVGWFIESEENRMAFLRDRCVAEIALRTPADDAERDEILSVRIAHEIDCSGRIDRRDAPDLLLEALKAWG